MEDDEERHECPEENGLLELCVDISKQLLSISLSAKTLFDQMMSLKLSFDLYTLFTIFIRCGCSEKPGYIM